MFSFAQPSQTSVPQIATQFIGSQMSFAVEVSQKMITGLQKIGELNIQVARAVLAESSDNTRQLLSVKDGSEAIAALQSRQQPSIEKVRAYQQHVQNIVRETQKDLSESFQQFVPQQTRSVQSLVQSVAKASVDQGTAVVNRTQQAVQQVAKTEQSAVEQAVEATAAAANKGKATAVK